MVFRESKIYTVIELGTSKISVLHGTVDKAGNPEILGYARHSSEGTIIKGCIVDYKGLQGILEQVLNEADKSLTAGVDRKDIYYTLTGPTVNSRQGEGSVLIYDEDRRIRGEHVDEAIRKARSLSLSPEMVNFNAMNSYFVVNSNLRVGNPVGQVAEHLDAYVHLISIERKRLETNNLLLKELGYEKGGEPIFSGVAAAAGTLSKEEQSQGVLLVDFGAGVCDYLVIHNDGILMSGVLPIGVDNLANDLSIGLDLSIDFCRKFLAEGRLGKLHRQGQSFVEIPAISEEKKRRIPLGSFEKILEVRLREIFSILKDQVDSNKLLPYLGAGCVLTGGGAILPSAADTMHEVMGIYVRVGEPITVNGAMSGFDRTPADTALIGLLKCAIDWDDLSGTSGIHRIGDTLENITNGLFRGLKNIGKAIKI